MKNSVTTWTGIGTRIAGVLAFLAAAPYQLGDIATILPPEWKPRVLAVSIVSGLLLGIWNAFAQGDAKQIQKLSDKVDHIDSGVDI